MTDMRFNVVYSGRLLPGHSLDDVKARFMKLFSLSEAQATKILAGRQLVLKKEADDATAKKLEQALTRAGLEVSLVPVDITAGAAEPAPNEAARPAKPAAEPKKDAGPPADELSPDQDPAPVPTGKTAQIPFEFQGTGAEYFKIWIVNIILSILTLGIYSAWAKVRRKQYFYGSTRLKGAAFEYLADPKKILKGRIVVFVLAVLFSAVNNLLPIVGSILSLAFIFVLPWIVVRSLKFNARNSAIRNIRFGFRGSLKDAAKAYVLWPIVSVFTIGLLFPYVYYRQKKFIVENSVYGTTAFRFDAGAKEYYTLFLGALIPILVGLLVIAAGGFFLVSETPALMPVIFIAALLLYLYLFAFFSVKTTNLLYNSSGLQAHRFQASLKTWDYMLLVLTNSMGIALTLGIFQPWAKIRTFRYKLAHMTMLAAGDLEGFVAAEQEQVSALGDEVSDFFDMDIGL